MAWTRRSFLQTSAAGMMAMGFRPRQGGFNMLSPQALPDVIKGERPFQASTVSVRNPRCRVPLSFIIDDSTCLVNLAYFGIPQFQQVFPDRYRQPWRLLPREIPDSFVAEFGSWCRDHGIKGKYSVVPYPACVGWVDRFLPGWSKGQLESSLNLIRDDLLADWDIHPEMISHTRVVDIQTGLPFPHATPEYMENWEWSQNKSADELAAYISYALEVLKRAGLPCEGHTTPGGFGGRNQNNLALGTLEAVRSVFGADIPHYFRNLYTEPDSVVTPQVYHASDLAGDDPRCVVSIVGCTGDWFGGWDGLTPGDPDRFITEDLSTGRLVEVIESEQPAVLVCHWPGIYYNGHKTGFRIFQTVVDRLERRYPNTLWMKNSELARYWAAKELTEIRQDGFEIFLNAPFECPDFTISIEADATEAVSLTTGSSRRPLDRVAEPSELAGQSWTTNGKTITCCFGLQRGQTRIHIS